MWQLIALLGTLCKTTFRFYPRNAMLARVLAVAVCLFVCVSVTRRYCTKTAEHRITQRTQRDSPWTLVYLRQQSLVGVPHPLGICAQSDPPSFLTPRFRPMSAHSASTVRAGEKSSISTNRKSPCAFQRAIDEPCTLPLSSPKGGTKLDFAGFASKIQLCVLVAS